MLAVLTVDTDQDVIDFNDGVTSLREAIFAANTVPGADEIVFDFGHDGPATILLTQGELKITDSLTITGTGAELLTIDASGSDPTPDVNDFLGTNVFVVSDGLSATKLDVSITGLKLTGADSQGEGGAIVSNESLTLRRIVLTGNHSGIGGGIAARASTHIEDCVIENNSVTGIGGGIFIYSRGMHQVSVINSTISGNAAGVSAGMYLYARASTSANIEGCAFTNNNAESYGGLRLRASNSEISVFKTVVTNNYSTRTRGGVDVSTVHSHVVLRDMTITHNHAVQGQGSGLSLRTTNSTDKIEIANVRISNNSSVSGAAALSLDSSVGRIQLEAVQISENVTTSGTIFSVRTSLNGRASIANSTISGNRSIQPITYSTQVRGDGFFDASHSTFFDNDGRSLFDGWSLGKINLDHVIIANPINQTANSGILKLSPVVTITNSLIGTNTGTNLAEAPVGSPDANGNIIGGAIHGVIDPLLSPLADNGGPTKTHALLPGSPAINAGDPSAVAGANGVPEFDQRGEPFTRVFGGRIDIGAFEAQSLVVDTLVDENDGDYSQGDFSLREAIDLANRIEGGNTIEFATSLAGGTILLTMGEMAITDSVEIIGLGPELLTIDASGSDPTPDVNNGDGSRIFVVPDFVATDLEFIISGLTLTGGDVSGSGGAILSNRGLTLKDVKVEGNAASLGGGVYNVHFSLNIEDSTFSENVARSGKGSAIYAQSELSLVASNISGNQSVEDNGQASTVYVYHEALVKNSTITNNYSGGPVVSGAALMARGQLIVVDSTVSGNVNLKGIEKTGFGSVEISGSTVSDNDGTGLYLYTAGSASSTILNSTISNNRDSGIKLQHDRGAFNVRIAGSTISGNAGKVAGGVYVYTSFQGALSIEDCLIADNIANAPNFTANELTGGGGIHVKRNSSLATAISRSTISGNKVFTPSKSSGFGGGILVAGGNAVISDCVVFNNSAEGAGGGICVTDAPSTILRTLVRNNSATDQAGGIYGQNLTLVDSDVSDNVSGNAGGMAASGTVNVIRTTFLRNHARASERIPQFFPGRGGALTATGSLTIVDSVFEQNTAVQTGGAIYSSHSLALSNSLIANNSADAGGGLWVRNATINNSTISHNTAVIGGGIYGDNITLNHSTVVLNSASSLGGGIFAAGTPVTLNHSIVARNSATHPDLTGLLGTTITARFSLIGSNAGTGLSPAPVGSPDANGNLIGTSNNPINPMLGPLADNGGPTKTHKLLDQSPAIDAGDPSAVAGVNGVPEFDQRGAPFTRIYLGRIDIGAYESQPDQGHFIADFDYDGDVDGRDMLIWQRGYGMSGPNVERQHGDATGDGDVDANDLAVWQATYGKYPRPGLTAHNVADDKEEWAADAWITSLAVPVQSVAHVNPEIELVDVAFDEAEATAVLSVNQDDIKDAMPSRQLAKRIAPDHEAWFAELGDWRTVGSKTLEFRWRMPR